MNSVFGHCRDSFWIVQFNLEVFVNLGVGPVEHRVQNWSSRLRIRADDTNLEHTVHVLDLELMAQRVSIMTSFFWACCDKGFWASCDKGFLCVL